MQSFFQLQTREVPRARSCVEKRRDGASRGVSVPSSSTMNPHTALDSDVRACAKVKDGVRKRRINVPVWQFGNRMLAPPRVPWFFQGSSTFRKARHYRARAHDTRWNQTPKNPDDERPSHSRTTSPRSSGAGRFTKMNWRRG